MLQNLSKENIFYNKLPSEFLIKKKIMPLKKIHFKKEKF